MKHLALLAGLAISSASFQAQAFVIGGEPGTGIGGDPSIVVEFRGTCSVDCNFDSATAEAQLGLAGYTFGDALELGNVTSFSYESPFGPFSGLNYLSPGTQPNYTVTAVSGSIPVLANPVLEGFPGVASAADVTISGTVTGLLGTIDQLDGLALFEPFTFDAGTVYGFTFETAANDPGNWSMLLTGGDLPPVATADAGTDGEFFLNSAVSQQVPGDLEVPEPGAIALFAIGLFGLGVARHRRRAA